MKGRLKAALFIMAASIVFYILLARAAEARVYADVEAHKLFDGVLYPKFIAATNEWALGHPTTPEHFGQFDVKDAKRWKAVRDAWRELDEAAKRMGY